MTTGVLLLLFAIGFNLWLYRMEPTAPIDPNDNTFQFALVYRTNQIWDFAQQKCSFNPVCFFSYLSDHWVPNWNEGYNLPFYYSHVPQIAIVGSYRLFDSFIRLFHYSFISLFTYYHVVIYLLLCFFPLSIYCALLIVDCSFLTAGFGAILASHVSTDGLYGLDPASFLWRGYGLSSQLFAMIWLPLAIAYAFRYFSSRRRNDLFFSILFLVLTTSGHIGVGIMAFLSLIPLALAVPLMDIFMQRWNHESWDVLKANIVKLTILSVIAIGILSYWLVPAFLADKFHNFSFWDPVWKFNSYGAKETITRLFNGDLFDFGRLPIFTALVLIGCFVSPHFAFLFIFWLLLYFGRTTWGPLIDLIPTMKEFHLSRFIVGVHLSGLFLAPIGFAWIINKVKKYIGLFAYVLIGVLVVFIYGQTIRYNDLNNTLITRSIADYAKQSKDANALVSTLQTLEKSAPGRVYAGRGGSWGHDFRISETNMTMYLGNFGLPTVLWMPETWSPNGDTEQYFRENKEADYDLFNIRYIATPANLAKENIQPFWKLIKENPSWKLYTVSSDVIPAQAGISVSSEKPIPIPDQVGNDNNNGYFTSAVRPAIVASDKYSRGNAIRLWIQSDDPKNGLYPELTFDTKNYPINVGLPNIKMLDEVTFITPDAKIHNVFSEPPKYISPITPIPPISLTSQTVDTDMIFSAKATVPENCTECLVILKQTYHPNWHVTVDGKAVTPIITFPFYIGIPVSAGTHTIVASYEPSSLKVFLLELTIVALAAILLRRVFMKN